MCRKFECRKDIHYKIQTGTSCENAQLAGLIRLTKFLLRLLQTPKIRLNNYKRKHHLKILNIA